MCNDYARELEIGRVLRLIKEMEKVPPINAWDEGRIPNDAGPAAHIRIHDRGLIVRLKGENLSVEMGTWAWTGPGGNPVFNFRSDGRSFATSDRLLIMATGFYEYTAPANPKNKLKDQHYFSMAEHDWFWIAGIEKQGCFSMLTCPPGPDMKPYHDRQVCVLEPNEGMSWLNLSVPEHTLLRPAPLGMIRVQTLRRNGEMLAP